MELKTSVAVLYRNLRRAAKDGVVPLAVFDSEAAGLALDDTARARLVSELSRLGLHLETPSVPTAPIGDSGSVKKVVRPRTEAPQAEARLQSSVSTALGLLDRYVVDGTVSERAVTGVSRLAGLTAWQATELREAVAMRFSLPLPAEAPQHDHMPASDAAPREQEVPPVLAKDSPLDVGDLASALAAGRAVIEDDGHTRRPEKRILTALEEVGLSVLLRGGPDHIAVEPTSAELRDLPVTHIRRRARDCLVLHNQKLAWSLVRSHSGQGLEDDDLFQHGMIGILRAVRKFDPRQGYKFSTYATWWLRQSMSRALADEGSAIRIPVHMHEQVRKVGRAERDLLSAGKSRSAAAVAVACDFSVSKVEEIRRISRVTDSTDRIIGDGTHLGELLENRTSLPSVEGAVMAALADEGAHALVALLPERFARVVTLRIGLNREEPATLDVIGAELGVTRERVRQLEAQAFAVLRLAFKDPAGNPHAALASMLADAQGDGTVANPVGIISRDLVKPDWRAGIEAFTVFRARNPRSTPERDHVEAGFPLGQWVAQQRIDGRAGGHRLPVHRRIHLDTLGMVWITAEAEDGWRRTQRARRRAAHAAGRRRLVRPAVEAAPTPVPAEPDVAPAAEERPDAAPTTGDRTSAAPSGPPEPTADPVAAPPVAADVAPVADTPAAPAAATVPKLTVATYPTAHAVAAPPAAPPPLPDTAPGPVRLPVAEHQVAVTSAPAPTSAETCTLQPTERDRSPLGNTVPEDSEVPGEASVAARYAGSWDEAVALSITLNRSVRWTAHYVHLALGHVLLSELLGLYPALTVAKVADGSKLPDRPVAQALDVLVRVVDGLKRRGERPEGFFECPSPALLGRSPRAYLSAYPLTKPEARLALLDALKEFPHSRADEEVEAPSVSSPTAPTPANAAPAEDEAAALLAAQAATDEAVRRFRDLEADVTDRITRARAAERNSARAQAQVDADDAARRMLELETSVAEQVAQARAEERNRARAETRADSAMVSAAAERERRTLRQMEEECARRIRDVEESAGQEVRVLEARLKQAEAAFAERVRAAQAVEHEATERVRAVERWAELRITEAQQAARSRITELEARLTPVHEPTPAQGPAPAPAPPGPQPPDPRRWWRRP